MLKKKVCSWSNIYIVLSEESQGVSLKRKKLKESGWFADEKLGKRKGIINTNNIQKKIEFSITNLKKLSFAKKKCC